MKPLSICASCALIVALSGCATTSGTAPTSATSGFDGAKVVSIDPHGLACRSMTCPAIGAQWRSTYPGAAVVTVTVFNEIIGVTAVEFNVDGKVSRLQPLHLTRFSKPGDLLKESRTDFGASMDLVREIARAQRAWLRVHTTDGSIEEAIVDGPTDSKAVHALRRFLAEVDKAS